MRVGLSYAHHPDKPGACYQGHCEHEESIIWTNHVAGVLEQFNCSIVMAPVGGLRNKVNHLNNQAVNAAVEIHFNGSPDPRVKGCETLYCPGSVKGEQLADSVHKRYSSFMINPDRGVKEGWYQMKKGGTIDYFLRATICPAIIIEPDFISQIENIQECRRDATTQIAIGILDFVESL